MPEITGNKQVWQKGQSGNPKGRPAGQSATTKMRESLASEVPAILAALALSAKSGDTQAARLILERVLPPVKAIELPTALQLPGDGTLTDKANAVLHACSTGQIAPAQASQLIAALGTLAKITEIDELTERITALEARHANAD